MLQPIDFRRNIAQKARRMADERVQRRLAAILAADMVGYSRLMGADENGTIARQRAHRAELIDPEIANHSGRIVKTTGDGMLVEFASVVDAVQCAIAVQHGMASRETDRPEDQRIRYRIGINLGDIVIDGDDILGDGVNIAARLEGLSEPGGVCISDVVHQSVAGKLDLNFDDLGEQDFKNIDKSVRAYALKQPGSVAREQPLQTLKTAEREFSGKPSVAVLPFSNMSGNSEDEYFSDGLTEDIITELSRFRDLAVIARNSTFQFKGRAADIAEIGRELSARYVVEGSVRRAGDRIRINAQLVEAESGAHIWADRWDRNLDDIFAVQDELTTTIAANLGARVQDATLDQSLRKNPTDLDAYECVLQARRFTVLLNEDEHAKARDLLERAIALDPGYSQAHALLANIYLAEYRMGFNPQPDSISRALRMGQRAVELDPQNAYARCWLAIIHYFRHETERFEAEAQRALSLNPNDAEILADIGHYYEFMGQYERGIALTKRAIALNPLHPGWYYFSFARYHYHEQDYQAALSAVERVGMPDFYWTHLLSAAILGQLGETQSAADALVRVKELYPGISVRGELEKFCVAPDDIEHLMEGLANVGLQE
ncbi:MAG: hypothetical protein GKS02_02325 [Alphaproteobacteria bacterium]|nr:hypothetical protein [Alphaproteobacteria bacterium]